MSYPISMSMSSEPPVKIKLKDIMRGSKRLILEHGDKPYLLSITRKGKLILTAAEDKTSANEKAALTDKNQ